MNTRPTDIIPPELIGTDLIVFDGVCVLCSGFFRFMIKHDDGRFKFATAQSPVGQSLYGALDLPRSDFETNLVIVDGVIYQRLDAFCAAMRTLGWPWRALGFARVLPRIIKDPMYHLIARNRYRFFGRTDTCMMPTPDVTSRFVTGGGR
jgi:predicted DCC family thiol-disulfide oxidoreductase YuxK